MREIGWRQSLSSASQRRRKDLAGLTLPAGMTKAGLPVGIALDGPEHSDHELLATGLALEPVLPRLPAPRLD